MGESEQETVVTLPFLGELTYREIHAVEDGFYCGVHSVRETEYVKEKHYWRMGWIAGDLYDQFLRE